MGFNKGPFLKAALKASLLGGSVASFLGHDPHMTHNFFVEVGGVVIGGFSEVGGLNSTISTESYDEGGQNGFTHKFPTRTSASDLVLSRGLVNVDFFWWWFEATSRGVVAPMNGTILMLNGENLPWPPMWWMFKQAYPVGWEGPNLNASSQSDVAVEKITLTHQGLTKFTGIKGAL